MSLASDLVPILQDSRSQLLSEWIKELKSSGAHRPSLMSDSELEAQCSQLIALLGEAVARDDGDSLEGPAWSRVRDFLSEISRSRGRNGFTPRETATFVLSLKAPLARLLGHDNFGAIWSVSSLLDSLGLLTVEVHQKAREQVIGLQQQEMLELSTPVIELWNGILALPIIGTLDSARAQAIMEALLAAIVESRSPIAILDITGVPTVDTMVAQHLLKTVAAARLMGAECIISGIRPQIAQTIVHLGVQLGDVTTKASLADAFRVALARLGTSVSSTAA
jgi:rsbT co-antagonist protein RsbR